MIYPFYVFALWTRAISGQLFKISSDFNCQHEPCGSLNSLFVHVILFFHADNVRIGRADVLKAAINTILLIDWSFFTIDQIVISFILKRKRLLIYCQITKKKAFNHQFSSCDLSIKRHILFWLVLKKTDGIKAAEMFLPSPEAAVWSPWWHHYDAITQINLYFLRVAAAAQLEFVQILVIVVVMMVMVVVITCLLNHYRLSARSLLSRHAPTRRRHLPLANVSYRR